MMVRAFHAAGIEVILDVVYNHTAEGNELGPTLCFRGVDNRSYYRLVEGEERFAVAYEEPHARYDPASYRSAQQREPGVLIARGG